MYVAFDLLALEDEDSLLELPFTRAPRRARAAARWQPRSPPRPSSSMPSSRHARRAPSRGSQHAEGAIAKERSAPYLPGERKGMVKVKRVRTIDAVLVGWRPGKEPETRSAR